MTLPSGARELTGPADRAAQDGTVGVSRRPSLWFRFRQHRGGLIGAVVVLSFVTAGLLAPVLAPFDPLAADVRIAFQPPSATHLLGTDEIGRDILSRLLYGATISIRVGMTVVLVGAVLGVPIGALSAYYGGAIDLIVQRVIDTLQAFPGILLLILVTALAGPSLELAVAALGVRSIPEYARLIRGNVLQVREVAFVEAARSIGCRDMRVLARHIMPNAITPVIIQSSLEAASSLILLAGISFLGFGAQPPTPEWGAMLAQGRIHMRSAPHIVIFPAVAVSLMVLGLNLVGDASRDALDPRAVYGRKQGD